MKTSMILKAVAAAALVSTAFAVSPSPTRADDLKVGQSVGGNRGGGSFSGNANIRGSAGPTMGSRGAMTSGINSGRLQTITRMQTSTNANFGATSTRGPSNFQTMDQRQSWNGNSTWNGNTNGGTWRNRNFSGDWNHHRRFRDGSNFAFGFGFGPGYYDDTYAYNDGPYYDDSYAYYGGDDGYVSANAGGGDAAYCMQRYRSYDPASGTFLGYDGLRHPCP